MRTKNIILITALSVVLSAAASLTVVKLTAKSNAPQHSGTAMLDESANNSFHLASLSTTTQLPDLTQAAQSGVKAVVNIENIQSVQVRRSGGRNQQDIFDFFFGPGQRQQPQQQQQQSPQTKQRRSGGSGVIISQDGYIVTNNHVITGADEIRVVTHDGRRHVATLVGTDPGTDIALLKIEQKGLSPVTFGNSDDLKLGQWVLAIGNPMGLSSTVTAGIVSAKGRSLGYGQGGMLDIESFIQTDAVVNPGNSGGALVTTDGNLVGINTILKSNTGSYIGYSFAVPSSIVQKVASDLREYGTVQRAVLGVSFSEISHDWLERFGKELNITEKEGLYIGEVVENSAAEVAGLRKNDVIIEINSTKVHKSAVLQEMLAKLNPGDKIKIKVKRDSQTKLFDVTLRNRAGKEELLTKEYVDMKQLLGAEFTPATSNTLQRLQLKHGLQVTDIHQNGVLAKAKVRPGFIIIAINEHYIKTETDLAKINDKIESIEGVYPDGKYIVYQNLK